MEKTVTKLALLAVSLAGAMSSQAWGSQIIDLQWSGASFGNLAIATGRMTIDDATIPNPGSEGSPGALPSWLTDLTMTVSGASSGNGTFTLVDFTGMYWDTAGGTLDLNAQLIGQATVFAPWGTTRDGTGGDLNFFSPVAPSGLDYFTVATDGGSGDLMVLVSAGPAVPEPATYQLLGTGLLGLLIFRRKRT